MKAALVRYFWPGLAVLCFGAALWMNVRASRAASEARAAHLAADSATAANDSTRMVALDSLKGLLGKELAAYERRAVQAEQRADSVDRALGRVRVALVNMSAVVRELSARAEAPVSEDSEAIRRAIFHVRQQPYTARAEVALPRPPAPGSLSLSVSLDSALIGLRLQCGKADASGVRPATALATTPDWLALRFTTVTQAPEICSPAKKSGGVSKWLLVPALIAGYLIGH